MSERFGTVFGKNYKDFLVVPFSSQALPMGVSSFGGEAHVSKPWLRKELRLPTQHPSPQRC